MKILSCLVSYRDLPKLRQALAAHAQIQVPTDCVVDLWVYDNSEELSLQAPLQELCSQFKAKLIILPTNLGVSGAYAQACQQVQVEAYDYLWLWDQDTLPSTDCLQPLLQTFAQHGGTDKLRLGAVSPRLQDPTGKDQHYVFYAPPFDLSSLRHHRFPTDLIRSGEVETTYFTNSGTLLSAEVVRVVGPPDVDFFMDLVDFEYSSRIQAAGFRMILNANTTITHQVGSPQPKKILGTTLIGRDYGNFRYYYQARNEILLAKKSSQPLRLVLKALVHLTQIAVRIFLTETHVPGKIIVFKLGIWDGLWGKKGKSYPGWLDKWLK